MAVRKQVLYDTKNMKYSGFVDCGGIVAESSEDQATEALVFLVVGLKHFWKCPIGYFLTNKLNGDAQASLIRSALSLLADHGFQVWSVTCDGTSSNLDTFRLLGCKFVPNYDNIKVSFHIQQETTKYMLYWTPVTWSNLQGILWVIWETLRIMNRGLLIGDFLEGF